jgi:Caspase domain
MSNTIIQQTETGKNYILSIAIDDYSKTEFGSLDHSVCNLDALFETLTSKYQFNEENIERLYNSRATKNEIEKAFNSFRTRNLTDDDSLLIFFSGHSELKNEYGTLILNDSSEFSNSDLLKSIRMLKNIKNIILFLNCCHSGTIFSEKENDERTNFEIGEPKCRKAIASNRGKEITFDDSNFIPTMTSVLGKNERKDEISASSIFDKMKYAMRQAECPADVRSGSIVNNEGGEFYFKLKKSEEIVWAETLKLNTIEGYSLYLKNFTKNKEEAQIELEELNNQEKDWRIFLKQIADKFQQIEGNYFAKKHLEVISDNNQYFSNIFHKLEIEEESNTVWKNLNKTDIDAVKSFIDKYPNSRFHAEAKVIHEKLKKAYEDGNEWKIIESRVASRRSKFDDNQKDYASYLAKHDEIDNPSYKVAKKRYTDVSKYLEAINEKDHNMQIQKLEKYIGEKCDCEKDKCICKYYLDKAKLKVSELKQEINNKKDEEDINSYFDQKSITKLKDFIETREFDSFVNNAEDFITQIEAEFKERVEKASKSDSVNQYVDAINFFDNYPDASNYREDLIFLKKEKDKAMYRLATTIDGCEDYILEFEDHNGMYLPNVKNNLDELKKEKGSIDKINKYRTIDLVKTVELCDVFLLEFTEGVYKYEVEKIKYEIETEIKDDSMFSEISKGFTLDNCKNYLKEYSKYKDKVNKEFDTLKRDKRDEDSYNNIVFETEKESRLLSIQELIQLCKNYLYVEFENGKFENEINSILNVLLIDQNEEVHFEEITSVRTIDNVKEFLNTYPNGRKIQDAENLLNELEQNECLKAEEIEKDNNDFANAGKLGTKEAFQEYLDQHPNGLDSNRSESKKNIKRLLLEERDREAFTKAKITNIIDVYKDYLVDFDNPLFAVEAQENIDKLERIQKDKEMFDKAIIENKIPAYNNYITEFNKDGKFVPIVIAKMNKLSVGDTLQNEKKDENIPNEWLKPASILHIISIVIMLFLLMLIAKKF